MVTEADLHAAVDDQLPPEAMADIEGWLREHPADATRMNDYRRQNAAMHRAYDALLDEPLPATLRATLKKASIASVAYPGARRHHWYWGAAVAASLVIGVAAGWQLRVVTGGTPASMQFARQAAVAHVVYAPEVRHPVEVGAADEAHLVAWLSKRLGTPLRIPHLAEQGYALMGGRLLPGQADERSLSAPVAQFMYQDARGVRLTLYVRTNADASRETAFRFAREKNISVFYWVDQKLGYALSGEMEKGELLRVANAVYKQLNP
jgi:anti-sigma factor RsiW